MSIDQGVEMEAEVSRAVNIDFFGSRTAVNPNICKTCDERGLSCCRVPKAEQILVPPISKAEIDYIEKNGNLPRKLARSFFVKKGNSKLFINKMLDLFPSRPSEISRVFPRHGMHYELVISNERCVLLGPHGCILPWDARPLLCRLYPFWFYGKEPYIFANDQCLAFQKHKTVQELCLALGTNLGDLYELHTQLCQRWGFSQELHLPVASEGIYPYQSSSPMLRQGLLTITNGA